MGILWCSDPAADLAGNSFSAWSVVVVAWSWLVTAFCFVVEVVMAVVVVVGHH